MYLRNVLLREMYAKQAFFKDNCTYNTSKMQQKLWTVFVAYLDIEGIATGKAYVLEMFV